MTCVLNLNKTELDRLQNLHKGHFDNPQEGMFDNDRIYFSGWVLSASEVIIEAKDSIGNVQRFILDQVRKDVMDYFHLSYNSERCGFDFTLDLSKFIDKVKIFVHVGQDSFCVWDIVIDRTGNVKKVNNVWSGLRDGSFGDRRRVDLGGLSELFYIEKNLEILYGEIVNSYGDIFPNKDFLRCFIEFFKSNKWAVEATQLAANTGYLNYCFYNLNVYCVASCTNADTNCLYFSSSEGKFRVYLLQLNVNAVIIFPDLALVYPLDSEQLAEISIRRLEQFLWFDIERVRKLGWRIAYNQKARFLGLNIAQARPYHYVHDVLHGVNYIENLNIKVNAVANPTYSFLNPKKFFQAITDIKFLSDETINQISLDSQGFYISPCLSYYHGGCEGSVLKNLFKKLREKTFEQSKSHFDLVIWIGISTEKRRWVEQSDGIVNVVRRLKKLFPNICVLIDGRTRVLGAISDYDRAIFETENSIFLKIEELLSNVCCVSLVGLTMEEKIRHAANVDVFLTHYLTDSMYVSEICEKMGLTYGEPNNEFEKNFYLHSNQMSIIPSSCVKILNPEMENQWQSVSMNWQDVYACIEQALQKIGKL